MTGASNQMFSWQSMEAFKTDAKLYFTPLLETVPASGSDRSLTSARYTRFPPANSLGQTSYQWGPVVPSGACQVARFLRHFARDTP